jgi:broad specificity phosphatase PhoE
VDRIIQGQSDIPLTKVGEQQAHAQRINLKNIPFSKTYSSDLIRARRTAEILNLEKNLAIQTTDALRERQFGSYQGKSMDVEGRKRLWDLLAHYSEHPHIKESGVETNEQMIGRSITFLREISIAHPGENILVVTHGGIMRVLLLHLGYAKEEGFPTGAIQNLAYIKLACDGVDFVVKETSGIAFQK